MARTMLVGTLLVLGVSLAMAQSSAADGATRTHYLRAEAVEWDYAPSGINQCNGADFTGDEAIFTTEGLGTVYKKAVFREYTDASFAEPRPRPAEFEHMGLLGPPLFAEVGDTLEVVLRNDLPFAINFDVQGVVLQNGVVNTGEALTYRWTVEDKQGPTEDQASSVVWLYRSTVDQPQHANAGLLGPVVVARKGAGNEAGRAMDVDAEYFLVLEVWNENDSPFLGDNLAGRTAEDFGLEEEDFEESNLMHGINGYVYCNLPPPQSAVGDVVRWHVVAVGNEVDLHTAHWHGHTFNFNGNQMDSLHLIPGVAYSLDMTMDDPGTWLLHCHVNDHIRAGMIMTYTVTGQLAEIQRTGVLREYFIAAEMVNWEYVPEKMNLCSKDGMPFGEDENVFLERTETTIGSEYLKARYVQYTDASFATPVERDPEDAYLGLLGPILRAAVGDTMKITFMNKNVLHPVTVHPHGVLYEKDSEGTPYADGTSGDDKLDDFVEQNQTVIMTWHVVDRAGPGKKDGSSVLWMYHSHVDEIADTNTGLVGALIVTRADVADPKTAMPMDVDREVVLFFSVIDEAESLLFDDNIATFLPNLGEDEAEELKEDEGFQESNLMHQINGFLYCNLPNLVVSQGQRVRWYVMALGTEVDMHTPNMQAATLVGLGEPEETLQLIAGGMTVADSVPRVPGRFQIACRIADHIAAGMVAVLTVEASNMAVPQGNGAVRTYFISADEVDWDYTPFGYDGCTGEPFDEDQLVFTETTETTLGSKYKKAVFNAYTDDTFTELLPKDPQYGIVGPLIVVEAGATLRVLFRNNLTDQDANFNVGGLVTENEVLGGGVVSPGGTQQYEFKVLEDAGPCSGCVPNTASYIYTSTVDFVAQSNAGLVGPLLVAAPGALKPNSSMVEGVDGIVPLLFAIQNENESPYLDDNIAVAEALLNSTVDTESEDFEESNLMHAVNGYLYCNMPRIKLYKDSLLQVVLMGMGSETDMHVPIFSGAPLVHRGQNVAAVQVMPSTSFVVDLTAPVGPTGVYDIYCDVHDHLSAGMQAQYVVADSEIL
ncbi:unnamed protein product [Ostreobium quekettii]|uniref:Multicopper oxidase n=1 Tax=Ostreobium quekettii TaxID=121088 RepID=A0A8S1IWX9_9CHLO|nr:unnamed protein product [Ostreobium quekettii]